MTSARRKAAFRPVRRALRRAKWMARAEKSIPMTDQPARASDRLEVPVPQPRSSARPTGWLEIKASTSGGTIPLSQGGLPRYQRANDRRRNKRIRLMPLTIGLSSLIIRRLVSSQILERLSHERVYYRVHSKYCPRLAWFRREDHAGGGFFARYGSDHPPGKDR